MYLFQFKMRVGADYVVGCAVEVFIFNCYVDHPCSGSFYNWGAAADFPVYHDIGVIHFSLLQCLSLLLCGF